MYVIALNQHLANYRFSDLGVFDELNYPRKSATLDVCYILSLSGAENFINPIYRHVSASPVP